MSGRDGDARVEDPATGSADTRRWPRPVPLIGDRTSSAERAADPRGWAFDPDERRALYDVVEARRDIRRFRHDPVPPETVGRLLGAAHAAPSVGHSQPWRFILVRDPATRDRAAVLADRERHRQAAAMDQGAAAHMLDLQLEGVREAPLGVVVCCDRRVPAQGVLGRATFVDADLWSCVCAIENLWLAARAEGLGVGWVTLFRPDDLARLLGLPDGIETLGWLCVGWPDERPPDPGLARAGWSTRQPVEEVVLHERWPTDEPAPPVSRIRSPGPVAIVGTRDHADRLLTPPGSLGVLDRAVDRLRALGISSQAPVRFVRVGADHPVTSHRVSTYADDVTREVLDATVAGRSLGASLASELGAEVLAVDAGVRGEPVRGAHLLRAADARGDLAVADALSASDVADLLAAARVLGAGFGRRVVVLGEVGIGNTTVAAALAAGQLGLEATEVLGLGAGGDTGTLDRKRATIAAALTRVRSERGGQLADPLVALAALGGPEIVVLAGLVLGAAEAGALVVLDGLVTSVAAVSAVAIEPAAAAHLVAGQRSRERAHEQVLAHLGMEPLLSLRFRSGEGAGALLATQMLLTAARTRAGMATVDGGSADRGTVDG
jgi:nicotinate-nucleotide--dimethylbenzimidazole phosphoribosyltransferase